MSDAPAVTIVGCVGGEVFGKRAKRTLDGADVVVGSPRHLASLPTYDRQLRIELVGALPALLDQISDLREQGRSVCVLASGDPGFFGITRVLAERLGHDHLVVHPAPSSISLAFAAVGWHWDDAEVVSAHGRELAPAIASIRRAGKVAVLTGPGNPPESIGAALLEAGCEPREVVVATLLGEQGEQLTRTDLDGLAAGSYDPMSVVLLRRAADADGPSLSWGRPEREFAQRDGMITKAEVRAVALGKLGIPASGVLWDIGAGSGSVAVEAAGLAPGLRVIAVERSADDAKNIVENAARLGVNVEVVVGAAPDALDDLPTPDRVFVGGGGPAVVRACWDRLRPGGRLVTTSILLDHALSAHALLGEMVQVQVNRSVPLGEHGVRFEPLNPVYIAWGDRGSE